MSEPLSEEPRTEEPRSKEHREARDRALKLLSRREHFRLELSRKLAKREIPRDLADAVLDELEERGWLDQERATRTFVAERLRRGPVGRRRLEAELGQRGVDHALAAAVLDESMPADENAEALRAAERKPRADPAALARHLERRGFSSQAILHAVRRREAELTASDR